VNFIGGFVHVATGDGGVTAIAVTERVEPQAVIGSELHRLAYPDRYAEHLEPLAPPLLGSTFRRFGCRAATT